MCYAMSMSDKITVEQAGALGGKKRWKKKTKQERSAAMKAIADTRWEKVRAQLAKQAGAA